MVNKELIQVVRDSLNDGDITAPDGQCRRHVRH
jgi:hypothetical protein